MESEAVIGVEGLAYFIVYEWVPLNLILASMKKTGPLSSARPLHFAKTFTYRACSNL